MEPKILLDVPRFVRGTIASMYNYYELKGVSAQEFGNGYVSIERRDEWGHKHVVDITKRRTAAVRAFVNAVRNQARET